jgi:hypothetical protein
VSGWPSELDDVFAHSLTCEFSSLTRAGTPVTWPVTPYVTDERKTIDISTGITYPLKAERARRDPRVALLFADPEGSGLEKPPVVYVRGHAAVRDANLQAGADRYVSDTLAKLGLAYKGTPWFLLKRHRWYWVRIWVEITPLHIAWWPKGNLDAPPETWDAPAADLPASDPGPTGSPPGAYQEAPDDWKFRAARAIGRLKMVDVSVTGRDGWPFVFPAARVKAHPRGFSFRVAPGCPEPIAGPGCITFHTHPERFTGQENAVFTGSVSPLERGKAVFEVERALGDFSLPVGRVRSAAAFSEKARKLRPRFESEVARRGQPIPEIRKTSR